MLEDHVPLLSLKGSMTSRARRTLLILLVLLVSFITLTGYHAFYNAEVVWSSTKKSIVAQLGTQSDLADEQARIGKISILYGDIKPYYERAMQIHKRHNRLHGYPMFLQRVSVMDGYWTKPAFIHYMLLRELRKPESQRLQWLFWFDADTIILNYNIPLEIFLPPSDDRTLEKVDVVVADDYNGLNNGIFGIRVTHYAVELFAAILAFRVFEPDTHLTFQDQSAMEILLKKRLSANHVAKVPQRWFNAYTSGVADVKLPSPYVHPGDLLVHFAGWPDRARVMNYWADKSEAMTSEWNKPLVNTSYPEETKKFWTSVKIDIDTRLQHWREGLKHLHATIEAATDSMAKWNSSTQDTEDKYKLLMLSCEEALKFTTKVDKYEDRIMDTDNQELDAVSKQLGRANRAFSEHVVHVKAKMEEEKKKKEEAEMRQKAEEERKKEEEKKNEEEKKKNEEEKKKEEEEKKKNEEEKKKKEEMEKNE